MLWSAIEQDHAPGETQGRPHATEADQAGGHLELAANPFAAEVSGTAEQGLCKAGSRHCQHLSGSLDRGGPQEGSETLQAAAANDATHQPIGSSPPADPSRDCDDGSNHHTPPALQQRHDRQALLGSLWQRIVRPVAQPQPPAAKRAALQEQHRYRTQQSLLATLGMVFRDIAALFRGHERRAAATAVWLAVFNQIGASTSIINYAPRVLEVSGVRQDEQAILMSSLIALAKTVGVVIGALAREHRWLSCTSGSACCSLDA